MSAESDSQQPSVLDEIRSTIASLDALRGRKPVTEKPTEAPADQPLQAAKPYPSAADTPRTSGRAAEESAGKQPAVDENRPALSDLGRDQPPVSASAAARAESIAQNAVQSLLQSSVPPSGQDPHPAAAVVAPQPSPSESRPALPPVSERGVMDEDEEEADAPIDLTKPSPMTTTACEPVPSGSVLESFLASTSASSAPQQPMTVEEEVARLSADSIVVRASNIDAKIMIVDDEPLNVLTFRQHLKGEGYSNFVTTEDATKALPLVRRESPDILLLDIHMPEVSGLDILRVMGLDPALQHIPVLILTASTDPKTRRRALDLGAADFLSKPIDPNELIPRVRNAIILKKHFDMVANEAARLEQQVERRTRQLEVTRQQLILSLARAAEHRDDDTGNHVIRVGRYAALVAREMGYPESKLAMFEQAAQLHDVGKIGIPDSILFKPGRLDPEQYELMKRHCAIGKQIIEPISEKEFEVLKTHTRKGENLLHVRSSPLLMLAARIAQTHHERWDGSGYPLGLSGTDIPLEGRIVAVADVFDALSSERPYKKPLPRERCFEILEEGRGAHFDPDVLDAFFRCSDKIVETQLLLMDEAPTPIVDHAAVDTSVVDR